jgi:uncharacterized membrane protein required for colicin V production
MKWIGVIILVIIGILAAIVAVEYLTVSIHNLPSFIPGHVAHKNGHYHKRGAVAAVIALLAFVGAGFWAYRIANAGKPTVVKGPDTSTSPASTDDLLSTPEPTNGDVAGQ